MARSAYTHVRARAHTEAHTHTHTNTHAHTHTHTHTRGMEGEREGARREGGGQPAREGKERARELPGTR